jgi:hypothetical protein
MIKALVVILIVFGLVGGLILTLRRTANMGTPSGDVLQRAKERAGRQAEEERREE